MGKIDKWAANQLPDIKRHLEVVSGVDFLHISTDHTIKKMRPRIGDRQMKVEDRTIPRICGSESLVGCILGHAGVRSYYLDKLAHATPSQWANAYFTIYRVKTDSYIRPGKGLVPDAPLTKELWVVPYAPECYEVEVERIGMLYLRGTVGTIDAGMLESVSYFHLNLFDDAILDDEKLPAGYYKFSLNGELAFNTRSTKKDVPNAYDIAPITRSEWTESLQKLKKVFASVNSEA